MADGEKLESQRLDEAAARRIIERATELDARLATESTVAQLRDAARDAGISEEAFSRALAEVRNEPVVIAPPPDQPSPTKRVVMLTLAVLVALGAIFAGMRRVEPGGRDIDRAARAAPRAVAPAGEAPPEASTPEARRPSTKTRRVEPTKVPPSPPR